MATKNMSCSCCGKDLSDLNSTNRSRHKSSCRQKNPPRAKPESSILRWATPGCFESVPVKKAKVTEEVLEVGTSDMDPLEMYDIGDGKEVNEESGLSARFKCQGYKPKLFGNIYENYPFHFHANPAMEFVPIQESLYHKKCIAKEFATSNSNCICEDCKDLEYVKTVRQIERNSCGNTTAHVPGKYLTHAQLAARAALLAKKERESRAKVFMLEKSKKQLTNKLSLHQRFVVGVAENRVPRLQQLLHVCFQQKRSMSFILQRLSDATSAVYQARGYKDVDMELGYLVLRIGGPRLLRCLTTLGLPSPSSIYRLKGNYEDDDFPLTASSLQEALEIFESNLNKTLQRPDALKEDALLMLKMDEISIQKRLRYNASMNRVEGLCFVHGGSVGNVISTLADAEALGEALKGSVHLASECLVIVACLGSDEHLVCYPLLSAPICSHANSVLVSQILETFTTVVAKSEFKRVVVNVGTDGDGNRRRVLHSLMYPPAVKVPNFLNSLQDVQLFDSALVLDQLTANFDPKHLAKRLRNRLIGKQGVTIGETKVTKDELTVLIERVLGGQAVASMLNPKDKQNVPMACKLLSTLSQLATVQSADMPNRLFLAMLPDLAVLGTICDLVLSLFAKPTLSLAEMVTDTSTLAYLLFDIYKLKGTAFIPGQLYYDLQQTVKDLTVTVAKLQHRGLDSTLHPHQLGSDEVEQLFSNVRTLTHDRNCDALQLAERLRHGVAIRGIFKSHPEWKTATQRLSNSSDHISLANWTGDLSVSKVDLRKCWKAGSLRAQALLSRVSWYDLSPVGDGCLLRPSGGFPGVLPLARDSLQLEDEADTLEGRGNAEVETPSDSLLAMEDGLAGMNKPSDSHFIKTEDGCRIHKATIVKALSSENRTLSADRLRRVQGMSKYPSSKLTLNGCSDEAAGNIIVGDPVFCLTTFERQVSLTVLEVTRISDQGEPSASSASLEDKVEVHGRVKCLIPNDNTFEICDAQEDVLITTTTFLAGSPSVFQRDGNIGFEFTNEELTSAFNTLLGVVDSHVALRGPVAGIPYLEELSIGVDNEESADGDNTDERPTLPVHVPVQPSNDASRQPDPSYVKPKSPACRICRKKCSITGMRKHIGTHILKGAADPCSCGFCGNTPACEISLYWSSGRGRHRNQRAMSECPLDVQFSLKAASKSNRNGPCTNRPISCPECEKVIWSYGIRKHYTACHGDQSVPLQLLVSAEERKLMGIHV